MTPAEEVIEALDTRCRYKAAARPECAVHGCAVWMALLKGAKGRNCYWCQATGLVFERHDDEG